MRYMITAGGCGKTTKAMSDALVYAKRYPTAFVTFGEAECDRLMKLYRKEMIGCKLEIITMRRLLGNPKKYYKRIVIDNIDMLLADLFFQHIDRSGTEANEMGRISLVTATGLPLRDLYVVRETAAAIWDAAAKILNDSCTGTDPETGIEKSYNTMKKQAEQLRADIPAWYNASKELEERANAAKQPE